jgi:acyl-CoA thioesterase FadM
VIRIRLAEVKRASMKFEYEVVKAGEKVTDGYTWHVLMGTERKAVSIPDRLKAKMGVSDLSR